MSNIILTFILLSNLCFLAGIAIFLVKARQIYADFKTFITPQHDKDGKEIGSPLAQTTEAMSAIFARSIVATLKTTFMGKQSGAVRGEQAIENALIQDIGTNTNPILGMLASFPAVQKALRKNPGLLDVALSMMQSRGKNQSSQGSNHSESNELQLKL